MTELELWLKTGADVHEGLRLLSVYKPNPYLAKMVEAHPDKYRALLIKTLSGITREAVASTAVRTVKMRDEWPFLSEDDCPIELKILAADKITAWKNYVTNHQKLFSVCSLEECLETAKNCVFFYCQNRKIFSEFAHYKEHKAILGKHPIFQELDRLKNYRGMDVLSLIRNEKNLLQAIWRLKRRMGKGDRPDLDESRRELLGSKERELAEVRRMISSYNKAYGR